MRLNNRVALVTGGGGGIGKEICLKLAAEGARVMIADITQVPREGGTSTLACLQDAGADAAFESVDVRQWADLDRAVSSIMPPHAPAAHCWKPAKKTGIRSWR